MYNPTDLFRYGGLTALGLALAATGLPANAAVAPAPANRVSTYLQADTQFAGQPSREERRAERREARGNRGDRSQIREQRREARQQQRREARQDSQPTRQRSAAEQRAWDARMQSRENYARQQRREARRDVRQDRREDRRDARRDARRDYRQDARRDYRRDARREARRDYRQDARRDYRRDVRLVSFAVHWIKAEIYEYVVRNWRMVKVATTKAQRKLFFNLRKHRNRLGWMKQDEIDAMAEDLNVDTSTVREMESRMTGADVAFEANSTDDDENTFWSPPETLGDYSADPGTLTLKADEARVRQQQLDTALAVLDERSRDIIQSRWLAESGKKTTLGVLAEQYGVSAERIRQIEAKALRKLKHPSRSRKLRSFLDN